MVHNSKARLASLRAFLLTQVTVPSECFEVSDVKADDTVIVRFKSSSRCSAREFLAEFNSVMELTGRTCYGHGEDRLRFKLDQFGTGVATSE